MLYCTRVSRQVNFYPDQYITGWVPGFFFPRPTRMHQQLKQIFHEKIVHLNKLFFDSCCIVLGYLDKWIFIRISTSLGGYPGFFFPRPTRMHQLRAHNALSICHYDPSCKNLDYAQLQGTIFFAIIHRLSFLTNLMIWTGIHPWGSIHDQTKIG